MGNADFTPAERPSRWHLQREVQRSAVTYAATSTGLWVIWFISGAPGGLPGVAATGDSVNIGLGIFPAWYMVLGLIRSAWEAFSLPGDEDNLA